MPQQQLELNKLARFAMSIVLAAAVIGAAEPATARPMPDPPVQNFSGFSFNLNFGPWQPRATLAINSHDTTNGRFTGTLTPVGTETRFSVNGQIIAERSLLPALTGSPPPPSYRITFSAGRVTYEGAIRIANSRTRPRMFMAGTFVSTAFGPRGPFTTSGPFPFCSISLSGILRTQTAPDPQGVNLTDFHLDLNFGPDVQEATLIINSHNAANGSFTGSVRREGDYIPVTGVVRRGVEPASYKITFDEGNRAKYEGALRLNGSGDEAFMAGTYRINISTRGTFLLGPAPFCGDAGRAP